MFNAELARRAIKEIEARPEEWNQGHWRCGTTRCFAGFVAFAAGANWADEDDEKASSWDYDSRDEEVPVVITPNDERMCVTDYAARELGLNSYDARRLFHGFNNITDLHELIDEFEHEVQ